MLFLISRTIMQITNEKNIVFSGEYPVVATKARTQSRAEL